MERLKLSGLKFPGYPAAEIARDLKNFLMTQGIFFNNKTAYRKELKRLGFIQTDDAEPVEILIEIKEGKS